MKCVNTRTYYRQCPTDDYLTARFCDLPVGSFFVNWSKFKADFESVHLCIKVTENTYFDTKSKLVVELFDSDKNDMFPEVAKDSLVYVVTSEVNWSFMLKDKNDGE